MIVAKCFSAHDCLHKNPKQIKQIVLEHPVLKFGMIESSEKNTQKMILMQLGGFPFTCSCSTQVCQKHRKHCLPRRTFWFFGIYSNSNQQKPTKTHKAPTENLEKKQQKKKAWFFRDVRGENHPPPALRCSEAHSDTLSDTSPLRCLLEVAGSWINNEKHTINQSLS